MTRCQWQAREFTRELNARNHGSKILSIEVQYYCTGVYTFVQQVKINPDGQVVDGNLGNKCPVIRFSAPTQQERDEWVATIKRCLGRDPMYDFIADRRRRAGSIRAPAPTAK